MQRNIVHKWYTVKGPTSIISTHSRTLRKLFSHVTSYSSKTPSALLKYDLAMLRNLSDRKICIRPHYPKKIQFNIIKNIALLYCNIRSLMSCLIASFVSGSSKLLVQVCKCSMRICRIPFSTAINVFCIKITYSTSITNNLLCTGLWIGW